MSTSQQDIDGAVDDVVEQLNDHIEVDETEVRDKINDLVNQYSVPLSEARRSVIRELTDDEDVDVSEVSSGGNAEMLVNEVQEDELWLDIEVQVVELWEPRSDSVSQVGLVGDESGTEKFTAFDTSELEELEEGQSYRLENVISDEYEGEYHIKLNKTTEITELDDDVEVGDDTVEISGIISKVYSDSGLIKRCPHDECTRVLKEGRCSEHGAVDDEVFDLRIKCAFDDGKQTYDLYFQQDATEEIIGMDISEAKELAQEELDISKVRESFENDITGEYFTVQANPYKGRWFADEFEKGVSVPDTDDLLVKARSL